MRFQHTSTYGAAAADVFAMFTDPEWRKKVGNAQGVVSSDITITAEGEGCRVVIDQVQNTAGLPSIAKKIAGETTRAVVTEVWTSPTAGTIEILAPGKPTKAVGTVTLESDGAETKHVTDLEVTVKVPAPRRQARAADGGQHRQGTRGRAGRRCRVAGRRPLTWQPGSCTS